MKNFEDIFLDIYGLYNRLQNFDDVTEHYINVTFRYMHHVNNVTDPKYQT